MIRQIGATLLAVFVFFAVVAAMSRLLSMKETPGWIDNVTKGISNLYSGAFQR